MKKFLLRTIIPLFILICFSGCTLPERPSSSPRSRNPKKTMSPEDIVGEFYELYFQCIEDTKVTMLDSCLGVQGKRPYFTKSNKERIREIINNLEEPDFNPFLCARNIPDKGYNVGTASILDSKATLNITFRYGEEQHIVPITLVQEKGVWKIDEIICE